MKSNQPSEASQTSSGLLRALVVVAVAAFSATSNAGTARGLNPGRPGPIGVNVWTPLGPDGGFPLALASDPSSPGTIYAGFLERNIQKSGDHGAHWIRLDAGLPTGSNQVSALAVKPGDPSTVLTQIAGRAVYRSTDAGLTWGATSGIAVGTAYSTVGTLRFDPSTPSTVYVTTAQSLPTAPGRFFKSTDSGATWVQSDLGLPVGISAPIISPTTPTTLLGSTGNTGLVKSTDGASTWQAANTGLPMRTATTYSLSSLTGDPAHPGVAYVLAQGAGQPLKLYKTVDAGGSWTKVSDADLLTLRIGFAHPVDLSLWGVKGTLVGAGYVYYVVRSTDGGLTWPSVSTGHRDADKVFLDSDGVSVYASFDTGLHRTVDNGTTWTPIQDGMRALQAENLAFAPSTGAVLWSSFAKGLIRTIDGGQTFSIVYAGAISPQGEAFAIHPADPSTVLTDMYPGSTWPQVNSGVVRTVNGGSTWTVAPNPLLEDPDIDGALLQAWGIAYDPGDSSIVYAAGPENPSQYAGPGVYKSTDGGGTFAPSATGVTGGVWPSFLTAVPSVPVRIFFGNSATLTGGMLGLWRSTDSAVSWQQANNGLPANPAPRSLVAHPSDPAVLFTGLAGAGVYKSLDGGDSWAPFGAGLPVGFTPFALAIDPVVPTVMFAGGAGVYRSLDGGANWEPYSQGIPASNIWDIGIDSSDHTHVVVATRAGLYETLSLVTDGDLDGVVAAVEDGAPNGGDGNADGIPDSLQNNVASFVSTAGAYVTLASPAGTLFQGVRAMPPPVPTEPGYTLTQGTFQFSVAGLTPGQCAAVTVYLTLDPTINTYMKYGPTAANLPPRWYSFLDDGSTGAEIFHEATRTRIVLHLCDGGRGDADVSPNGVIVDPGGPAQSTLLEIASFAANPEVVDAGQPSTLTWAVTNASSVTLDGAAVTSSGSQVVAPLVSTVYSLHANAGAVERTSTTIVKVRPTAVLSGDATICAGQSTGIQVDLTGTPPWSVTWSDGAPPSVVTSSPAMRSVSPGSTTVYTVTAVSDAIVAGTFSGSATVTVNALPAAPAITTLPKAGAGSPNRSASVPAHLGSTYTWAITNGTITSGDGTASILYTAGSAGPLTLSVTETEGANGCTSAEGTATVQVGPAGTVLSYYFLTPCRIIDTRGPLGPLGGPALAAGVSVRTFMVTGTCSVPATAKALAVNQTIAGAGAAGFIRVYPGDLTGTAIPITSAVSFAASKTRACNGFLKLASDGSGTIGVENNALGAEAHFILDVTGYFE